uniref:NADH:ubiquinone oxidoreductase-like 20kDa subunit domain-containing protein n=1 Tax=Brassica oleracea var. oleracea TaxID=109376 RepID=A0A0D3C3M6_BRAOL
MFSTDSYSTVRGVDKLIPVDVYMPDSTVRGVDKLIPVDVYLSGCPPKPEAVIDAITKLPPWPSGQGLKASTPRSGVRTPDNAISTGRGLGFNYRKRRIMQKIRENAYKRSSAWRKEYRQEWIS